MTDNLHKAKLCIPLDEVELHRRGLLKCDKLHLNKEHTETGILQPHIGIPLDEVELHRRGLLDCDKFHIKKSYHETNRQDDNIEESNEDK